MSERKRYPSDLTDERWALIEPVITAWKAAHRSVSGHQGGYEMREIVNAILYQCRTGCQWEYLPHDLPPRSAAYYYFARWRDDGTDQAIHDLLRWHAREKKGRKADPSLVVLDTQSVHAAASVPADTTGRDAGKKVPGRKRCLAVDVLGLVIAVVVLAASAHENTAGIALLDRVAANTATVSTALVDQGFKNSVVAHGATVGIDVQVVERNPADKGFVPQPKRWVVEQTFGILSFHRRLVRDYEHRLVQLGIARVLGDDRRDGPAADRHVRAIMAARVTTARTRAGTCWTRSTPASRPWPARPAQAQARIDELTARLRELNEAISDLQVTRKTLISLAGHDDGQPAAEPAGPPPVLPDHPAYQQILDRLRRPPPPPPGPRPVPGPGPADRAQEHREHPLQAQAPGQPRHPHRDRTRLVRPATPITRPAGLRPGHLTQPRRRKGHQPAKRPLSRL